MAGSGTANKSTDKPAKYDDPTYGDNINWFVTYQMGFMYWRYFMWNFAGKQNDIQGFGNKETATGYQAFLLLTMPAWATNHVCLQASRITKRITSYTLFLLSLVL
jgi:hypothetical protein